MGVGAGGLRAIRYFYLDVAADEGAKTSRKKSSESKVGSTGCDAEPPPT